LSSASIKLRQIKPLNESPFFSRELKHTLLGVLNENIHFHQMQGKIPTFGKVEINSKAHGPLGEIEFSMVSGMKGVYNLYNLETRPWMRKQGIAGQILAETIDILKKKAQAKTITLTVDMKTPDAPDAIKLYEKFGFVVLKNEIGKVEKNYLQMVLKF